MPDRYPATRHLGLPPATRNVDSHFCTFAQEHRSDLHLRTLQPPPPNPQPPLKPSPRLAWP